jgi:hypothetical protein
VIAGCIDWATYIGFEISKQLLKVGFELRFLGKYRCYRYQDVVNDVYTSTLSLSLSMSVCLSAFWLPGRHTVHNGSSEVLELRIREHDRKVVIRFRQCSCWYWTVRTAALRYAMQEIFGPTYCSDIRRYGVQKLLGSVRHCINATATGSNESSQTFGQPKSISRSACCKCVNAHAWYKPFDWDRGRQQWPWIV